MDDMIDVKMPPPPEPEPEPLKMEVNEDNELEAPEEDVVERQVVPDEEVFKEPPQVKKVKRKPSEKQLAHLKKMREKKEANRIAKQEWLEEQKSKQKKFVEAEEKEVSRVSRAKPTKINKKIKINSNPQISNIPLDTMDSRAGRQNEPINQEVEYENPEYQGQYYEEPTAPPQQQVGLYQLSAEQIQELQFNAINDYDTIRKQRKAEKEAQQAQEYLKSQRQKVFKQMRGSQQQFNANDPWASCFN